MEWLGAVSLRQEHLNRGLNEVRIWAKYTPESTNEDLREDLRMKSLPLDVW